MRSHRIAGIEIIIARHGTTVTSHGGLLVHIVNQALELGEYIWEMVSQCEKVRYLGWYNLSRNDPRVNVLGRSLFNPIVHSLWPVPSLVVHYPAYVQLCPQVPHCSPAG